MKHELRVIASAVAMSLSAGMLSAPAAEVGATLDEVKALAREEGVVRVGVSWQGPIVEAITTAMQEKYGVQVEIVRLRALASRERALSEAMAGVVEYDLLNVSSELQPQFIEAGVLEQEKWKELLPDLRDFQVSPDNYFIASGFSRYGIVYNPKLVPQEHVPSSWDDCLDPYWKGKVAMYTRPRTFTALWNSWGKERMVEYQKKIRDLEPIWVADQTSTLMKIAAGEYPMGCGYPAQSMATVLEQDPTAEQNLVFVVPSELPVHIGEAFAVMKQGENKNAAVLLAGFLASAEGQKAYALFNRDSPFIEGTESAELVKQAGAKVVWGGWEFSGEKEAEAAQTIVETWGFPTGQ